MKRIRQGWNTLRRSRRSGVSLIVALCAVAVLIGLSLSIVYSSSMLLSRGHRKIGPVVRVGRVGRRGVD